MKTTLSTSEAIDMLMSCEAFGTEDSAYSLCRTMIEYLEQYEDETGVVLDLDPIAIKTKWKFITLQEAKRVWSLEDHEDALEWMLWRTTVIETQFKNAYIIEEF